MTKILIDLNIILDFLNKRNYHKEAADLINRCAEHELSGFMCAHEVTTLSYFLVKEDKDRVKARTTITALMNLLTVITVDEAVLRDSLLSPITDYEDAVIEVSSMNAGIDCIISRNIADFKHSRIPAYTPEQFFLV